MNPERIALFHRIITALEGVQRLIGHAVAWVVVAMAALTFGIVVLRYVFSLGWIWLQELVVYLHAALFMGAAGYTLLVHGHVRVDVFFRDWSPENRARVDFYGTLLLLLPVCLLLLWFGVPYVFDSWARLEGSPEAGGIPAVFVLKTMILVLPLALLAQGTAVALRAWLAMHAAPVPQDVSAPVKSAEEAAS